MRKNPYLYLVEKPNHVMKSYLIIGFIMFGMIFAPLGSVFADAPAKSIQKQRPQADEIKAKAQTLVKGKAMEDRVAKMKMEAQKATSKFMRENAKAYDEKMASDLQKSFLKQAELKAKSDELHRKIIQDKIAEKSKLIQLKIKQMVEKGQLGMHEKKTIEHGRTK